MQTSKQDKTISVEDLCKEKISSLVLNSFKEIKFVVGVELTEGQIAVKASASVPVKTLIFIVALWMLQGYMISKSFLIKIINFL